MLQTHKDPMYHEKGFSWAVDYMTAHPDEVIVPKTFDEQNIILEIYNHTYDMTEEQLVGFLNGLDHDSQLAFAK